MDTQILRKSLNERVVTVTFKKKNGDIRVMDCTTNLDSVPPSEWPTGKISLSEESRDNTVRVYDVKARGWRSFVIENVVEFK